MYAYVITTWVEGGQHFHRVHILEEIPISRGSTLPFDA